MKLTKMDVTSARSRSGLGVAKDAMRGARKCWRMRVSPGRRDKEMENARSKSARDPQSKMFLFRKIR